MENNQEASALDNFDDDPELNEMLYARHAEITSLEDLTAQRGTTIPALFNTLYKFVQNPSSVSVETYKRMIDTDDTLGSGIDFLTICLAARLGKYTHPNKKIAQWVNDQLKYIKGGFYNLVKEILSATWAGFAVAEKVWENHPERGFVIKKCVTLPPSTILFETDRTGELTTDGVLQFQRNWNPMAMGLGIGYFGGSIGGGFGFQMTGDARPDAFARFGDMPFPLRTANSWNYLSIRIPAQKVIHFAFDAQGKFGNPYGRSLLRRCYKYWVLKDSVMQMLATALDRKGTPLTIVYADGNTTLRNEKEGAVDNNARNQRRGIRADDAARQAFQNIHNDSTIILPGKKGQIFDTDFISQNSNNDAFQSTLDYCNKSMMRAMLIPSLIFTNGDGTGSYSLGQEHAKTFAKIMDGMLSGVKECIIEQMVYEYLMYNFPKEEWNGDRGDFAPSQFADEDMEKLNQIWTNAITNGVIDTTDLADLNRMRQALGFPERQTPIDNSANDLNNLFQGENDNANT